MNAILALTPHFAQHSVWVVGVFVLAGFMGGTVGYLMNNASVKWRKIEFLKSLVFGILVSGGILTVLGFLYAELFVSSTDVLLNLVLAGCICFMFSVVFLMFAYRFLMRMTSSKSKSDPLKVRP